MTTHYEDGMEVPKVVGTVTASGMRQGVNAVVGRLALHDLRPGDTLMTVAQHERIVLVLKSEIVRLREARDRYCELWNRAGNMVTATTAPQVGGDGRLEEAERLVREAWRLMPDDGRVAVSVWHLCASEFINAKTESGAALAPAAVVLPDRKHVTQSWNSHADAEAKGWNAALDEVALLNRRAIPVGLLKNLLAHVEAREYDLDTKFAEGDELRALLGKENI